jgi:hypothetical protein
VEPKPGRQLTPRPHLHPSQVPLRTVYLFMEPDKNLTLGWEDWTQSSVAQRVRPLSDNNCSLLIMAYGSYVGGRQHAATDKPESK